MTEHTHAPQGKPWEGENPEDPEDLETPEELEDIPGNAQSISLGEQSWDVPENAQGQRLDAWLSKVSGISRSRVKQAIEQGTCSLLSCGHSSAQICTSGNTRLVPGQRVSLGLSLEPSPLQPEEGSLDIVYQDSALVVLNKPARVTVHPCPSCLKGTLVHRLLAHFPELALQEGWRPGIVHRLDKDTSGLLVIALTEPVRLALTEAFAKREVQKTYLALVHGVPAAQGTVDQPLGRHPVYKTRRAVVPLNQGGKPALTTWETLYSDPGQRFSLLAVSLHTGRTHQIRVHMAHIGHPLWGDQVYSHKQGDQAPRQMLHAWKLAFEYPVQAHPLQEHAPLAFTCAPPADFLETALALTRRSQQVIITGTPGCGKSTLLQALAERGLPTWSADAEVAALYAPGGDGWHVLKARFGERFLAATGIDKTVLGKAMAEEAGLRAEVEALIHPLVFHRMRAFFQSQQHQPVAVAEVPLWHEKANLAKKKSLGNTPLLDKPVLVHVFCPQESRWQRLREVRHWTAETCESMDSWQWPEQKKIQAAHVVVQNTGSRENFALEIEKLLEQLACLRAQKDAEHAEMFHKLWSMS